jgi:bis(5'-nucleosyl)-tetraphosphatase (symmetrical)
VAIYAIGDVQGCCRELEQLLESVAFDPAEDVVWFVGDLVNRGPDSLGVLRLVEDLGDSAVAELGNHDLHLIACALGVRRHKRADTLSKVLRAKDRKRLIEWLRHRPLVHREHGHVVVHAGLAPEWTASTAARIARDAEEALQGKCAEAVLERYGSSSFKWRRYDEDVRKKDRIATALRFFTRLRCLRKSGLPHDDYSGPPSLAPHGLVPWFDFEGRRSSRSTVVFGHWAALGLRIEKRLIGLDSGCVWGRALTAVRLDDRAVFQI